MCPFPPSILLVLRRKTGYLCPFSPLQILLVLRQKTGYLCPFYPSDITRITAKDWLPVPFPPSSITRTTVKDWLPVPLFPFRYYWYYSERLVTCAALFHFRYYSYYGERLATCALFSPSDITSITTKDWLPVPFYPLQILLVLQRKTGYLCRFHPFFSFVSEN